MPHPYPLDQALPPSVFTHRWQKSAQYINYPVFSWPWFWRRACVFGPIGFVFGALLATPVGLYTGEWPLVVGSVMRLGPAWAFIMTFGSALGTWVRHKNLGLVRERRWLVVAVLAGISASYASKFGYESYLETVIAPVLKAKGTFNAVPMLSTLRGLNIFYEVLLGFFIVSTGGGRALLNYFSELRRWETFGTNQEIQAVKLQRDDADRKLAVLQAQVEPHFLYNTLASIRSLVRSDPARAEATIDALGDHLRSTLPKIRGESAAATLGDQLEICRSYLEVMRVRTGGRLGYAIDADPDLTDAVFPPLMLISLVENAVKHGVEPKPGPCSIIVSARRVESVQGTTLELTVTDNGIGLREGPGEGLGLANIKAQLATRYGERASLQLQAGTEGGVVARLAIPLERT